MFKLLCLSTVRLVITSTGRWLCSRLKSPDQQGERQLKKVSRYIKDAKYAATEFMPNCVDPGAEGLHRQRLGPGPKSRNSSSGAVMSYEGCRNHAQQSGQPVVAVSLREADVYAARGGLREAILMNPVMEFLRRGSIDIELLTDSVAARQLCHNRGVGKLKHLKKRALWLQKAFLGG